jgi:hypothetical protein
MSYRYHRSPRVGGTESGILNSCGETVHISTAVHSNCKRNGLFNGTSNLLPLNAIHTPTRIAIGKLVPDSRYHI